MLQLLVVVATVALLWGAIAPAVRAAPGEGSSQKLMHLARLGTTRISGGVTAHRSGPLATEIRQSPEEEDDEGDGDGEGGDGDGAPSPRFRELQNATRTPHFEGLNHFDNRFAGTGDYTNTQFSLEPPDQALCVGNGFVVESVNTVIRVRGTDGSIVTPAMPLNDFFNLAPEVVRSAPPVFGDFTSDPKCYYDVDTDRWFVTILQLGIDPPTGGFTGDSSVMIAVSQTGDPTGIFNIFAIDTTNDGTDGTPTHDNCPCFGDQPLIGADAYGFYVTTNEFPVFVAGFNGANVYAMSKTALAAGSAGTVVALHEPTLAEGQAYSIQPATTPPGGRYATHHNGTEYFLSALEFEGTGDRRIALWALTNTASLNSATPSVDMRVDIVRSELYSPPPVVKQRRGPTPLRSLLKSDLAPAAVGVDPSREPIPQLNSNDDRMNQVMYADGKVWGALNTAVRTSEGKVRSGIAWFSVRPKFGPFRGRMANQGYVAIRGANAMFPAVAVTKSGKAIVAYSVAGSDLYPGIAYSRIGGNPGKPQLVARGVGPADGFTGYDPLAGQGDVERWGDYSAATVDENGAIWFATETINQRCTFEEFLADTTCGGTRSLLANWGTMIARFNP
ncbi:MAG TPA: hypothetical protein VFK61_07300 [Candidatus Limnocylindria bacterium]|nr:hypothetical protein [Candidatus Limnocylindria bacterium]